MDKLEELDKFLKICNLQRLNHKETENLNRLIMSTEVETVMKTSQQGKAQDQRFIASLLSSTKHLNN